MKLSSEMFYFVVNLISLQKLPLFLFPFLLLAIVKVCSSKSATKFQKDFYCRKISALFKQGWGTKERNVTELAHQSDFVIFTQRNFNCLHLHYISTLPMEETSESTSAITLLCFENRGRKSRSKFRDYCYFCYPPYFLSFPLFRKVDFQKHLSKLLRGY